MPMAANSSSACTTANVALPSGVTRNFFSRSVVASTTDVDGVMGYHATHRYAREYRAHAGRRITVDDDLAAVWSILSITNGSCLVSFSAA